MQGHSLESLKGVGAQTIKKLESARIYTRDDLLAFYPSSYESLEEIVEVTSLKEECTQSLAGCFIRNLAAVKTNNMQMVSGEFFDQTGKIKVIWYHMPYLKKSIQPNKGYVLRGCITKKNGRLCLLQPTIFLPEEYDKIKKTLVPHYRRLGISSKLFLRMINQSLSEMSLTTDFLPENIRKNNQLAEYNYACWNIHFPKDLESLKIARRRLVFDEFFVFLCCVLQLKEENKEVCNPYCLKKNTMSSKILQHLPYSLTKAQKRTWKEIIKDLQSDFLMNRLVQGDVGCGKTILAFLSMIMVAENGYQSALMAPTEVLARQHMEGLNKLLLENQLEFKAVLLVGSMTAKEKKSAYALIESGEASLIIGTHAVIQEKVVFKQLALVITDEQHRFGVKQRECFLEKSNKGTHIIVMSATPIPRTLALILYGDLDISLVDEVPATRLPIKNCAVGEEYTKKAWKFLANEIEKGRQAYVVCSMVEESEAIDAENVIDYAQKLNTFYQGKYPIGILHGKMKAKEKEQVMEEFLKQKIKLLVSTTVIEVGVNVPNATVMLIENAERFGLSQLHQLRGRVGRGTEQSYCIFLSHTASKIGRERLNILTQSNDGFAIASEDLKQRGPGDFYGIRQSGELSFVLGDIYTDADILKDAKEAASLLLEDDPSLEKEEHMQLKKHIEIYQKQQLEHTVL